MIKVILKKYVSTMDTKWQPVTDKTFVCISHRYILKLLFVCMKHTFTTFWWHKLRTQTFYCGHFTQKPFHYTIDILEYCRRINMPKRDFIMNKRSHCHSPHTHLQFSLSCLLAFIRSYIHSITHTHFYSSTLLSLTHALMILKLIPPSLNPSFP